MADATSTSGPTVDQKDIPAQTSKPVVQIPAPASAQPPPAPPPEDLYAYEHCTVMVVLQLRPQRQEGGLRPVLLSVQNGTGNQEDLPLYRLLSSEEELGGPLPPVLVEMLEALRQDLPARRQRHEQRAAHQTASTGGTNTRAAQRIERPQEVTKQKKPGTATTTTSPPPPIPTAVSPLPKEGLVLGGLFDDL